MTADDRGTTPMERPIKGFFTKHAQHKVSQPTRQLSVGKNRREMMEEKALMHAIVKKQQLVCGGKQ